jgi:hypothetical protein
MIRELVTEYKALQTQLQAAGRRLWGIHQFLRANGVESARAVEADDPDLAVVYLRLDGWRPHPTKPDVWIP